MTKIVLDDTNSGYNLSKINSNFDKIEDYINNDVLSRQNPTGDANELHVDIDTNGNRIYNLPKPLLLSEPLRLQDLSDFVGGGFEIPVTATQITVNPVGGISSTNVQDALQELSGEIATETTNRTTADTSILLELHSNSANVINSIASLRASNGSAYSKFYVTSYYSGLLGGGGWYLYDAADTTSTDNGGTVIVSVDNKRWKLQTAEVTAKHFGLKGDGVTDDSASALAAFNWLIAKGGGVLKFGTGVFIFNQTFTLSFLSDYQSISLLGNGQDNTRLVWTTTNGMVINYKGPFNSVKIRDMNFETQTVNTSTAIRLVQTVTSYGAPANSALSDFTNVSFKGADGYQVNQYWTKCIDVFQVSNINYTGVVFAGLNNGSGYVTNGIGVIIQGTSVVVPVVHNFLMCTFNGIGSGIVYGTLTQGVFVNQCEFTGGSYGVVTQGTLLDQLNVYGSQFNVGSSGINQINNCPQSMISNNLFIVPNSAIGISFQESLQFTITGNMFVSTTPGSNNGVVVGGTQLSQGGVITANSFVGFTGNGVWLQSTSNYVKVNSNFYSGNASDVLNSGTNNSVGVASA